MSKFKFNITGHCLVTGSSSGIGKAIALEFASKGVPIVAVSIDKRALIKLKQEIKSVFDVDCYILNKDLLDEESPLEIYQWCMDNKIDVQILINNIGLGCSGSFEDSCEKSNETLVRLNLFPMLHLTRLFLPTLKSYNNSYILNMSSLGRCIPIPYKALYAASKSFVYSFSKALSVELKSTNVQVSVSCPAGVYTNPHVVQRINSGGIIAKWTSLSVGRVSYFIVNSMLKGKKTIVPGIGAKFLLFLMRVLPESLNILIAGRMIKKNEG